MGLKFPEDLDQWRTWAEKQNLLRYAKNKILPLKKTGQREQNFILASRGKDPAKVLIALEAATPTQLASLVLPAEYLQEVGISISVVAPLEAETYLKNQGYSICSYENTDSFVSASLVDVQEVIAVGNYLPVGEWAYQKAQDYTWGFNVIQHGLNTPFAPPLPANSTLFAFSQADADFWISGRNDIAAEFVGSQLFYEALQQPKVAVEDIEETPVFLGQMHGAELSRLSFAQAGYQFSQNHGAIYRPHPSEKDKLSLLTHKLWAKRGITIDSSNTPLNQLNNPIVSVFSTGVLEAAMRGIPAWVYHPNPPVWLQEFWKRYGMRQWGDEPTPAPAVPTEEPALVIAQKIAEKLEK